MQQRDAAGRHDPGAEQQRGRWRFGQRRELDGFGTRAVAVVGHRMDGNELRQRPQRWIPVALPTGIRVSPVSGDAL